ncbi:hypothetical protein BGZ73_001016, partial [Actinomortierella ambigua]
NAGIRSPQQQPTISGPLNLYSDGSYVNAGTPAARMSFGAVDESGNRTAGMVEGAASSTNELLGPIGAIISAPPQQDIFIKLDNSALVHQFQQLVWSFGARTRYPANAFGATLTVGDCPSPSSCAL